MARRSREVKKDLENVDGFCLPLDEEEKNVDGLKTVMSDNGAHIHLAVSR